MLYAILCYHNESGFGYLTKEQVESTMAKLAAVNDRLQAAGKLGPVVRLMPTTTATSLKKHQEPPLVIDGPFAETKEQLLGMYVVECESLDDALNVARDLGEATPGGTYELRPIMSFRPGVLGHDHD
jgi:hypothetical protein